MKQSINEKLNKIWNKPETIAEQQKETKAPIQMPSQEIVDYHKNRAKPTQTDNLLTLKQARAYLGFKADSSRIYILIQKGDLVSRDGCVTLESLEQYKKSSDDSKAKRKEKFMTHIRQKAIPTEDDYTYSQVAKMLGIKEHSLQTKIWRKEIIGSSGIIKKSDYEDYLKSVEERKKRVHEPGKQVIADEQQMQKASDEINNVEPNHYKIMKIDPFEYSFKNKLDPLQFSVIKYVSRFRNKNGLEDLQKAKKCLEMLINFEYGSGQ